MSAATKQTPDDKTEVPEVDQEAATQLTLARVTNNPVSVFTSPESLEVVYASIEKEIADFVPDLSTVTSRKKIAALSAKVTKTKTAIDAAGKDLNSALREQINGVDAIRRSMRDRLDDLSDLARQPLTDWEKAEADRKARIERDLEDLRGAGTIFNDDTLAELEERLAKLKATEINAETFGDFATDADGRRKIAIEAIENAIERIHRAAAEAAELEASRQELAKLRELQAEREKRDAERAEAERIEREEAARIAREKADQEARARAEEERAERERERRERDAAEAEERMKAAAIAAEKRAREEAAAEAEREKRETEARHAAELKRIRDEAEAERRDREAAEARKAAEIEAERKAEEKRQADQKHRAKVMADVHLAICAAVPELDEQAVMRLVQAIAAGKIARTAIQF
ncbi:hypothetical protein ASG43_03170 [Aureimonas sp. Leaf454]|uniref:hypothetical protein n=1 Tax=Aureimonas sp. Leaf454 TaxID=1736381 RepID=UPI0006F696DC|nr:hypothetical protein [Aureimonas sp. Leaf454]KQT54600.1 hypothetical protein ASG43_03170 [Aureimonas sp. Leaf454]